MVWRYAKESVRQKISARNISDKMIENVLSTPDSIAKAKKGRIIAQKIMSRYGFGNLLIRVIYEEIHDEKVVITAYWSRPERYLRREEQ